jgi:hypothetical protein
VARGLIGADAEAGGRDGDDRQRSILDRQPAAHDAGIATERALPEAVAQNDDARIGARARVVVGKTAAKHRTHAEHAIQIARRLQPRDLFGAARAHHVERRRLHQHQRLERTCARLPLDVVRRMHGQELPNLAGGALRPRRRRRVTLNALDHLVQHDQPIGLWVRQRPQQDRIDDRENGRVGADGEGE